MIRNIHSFGEEDGETIKLGVLGCSPLGKGTEATFKDFTLNEI